MSESFAGTSVRLAGQAGLVLGWTPDTFWSATPAELAALVAAARGDAADAVGGTELTRLMEAHPDG